jgi:YD repeat-containing protein
MGEINKRVFTKWIICLTCMIALQACKHPLAIVGEGDIVDANNSGHGCTLEQFQAQDTACTENEVSGDYIVNYKAVPRSNWRFVRWEGPCSPQSDFQHCSFNISEAGVAWWEEMYPESEIPPSTAVFAPITGEAGYLLAGAAVAGVAWETPTQQGVTGSNGRFQYEEGETVRFMVGDTVLGEVTGQAQITPFDLASSPVLKGIHITWAVEDEDDPFQAVINIAVLLQSLDHDANPGNGIQIKAGVATLFQGVSLDVSQDWGSFQEASTLNRAMGQANRKRLFSEAHGVVKPAAALEHLYGALEIDARTLGVSRLQTRASDSPEYLQEEHWQYDANGNVTRHEVDGNLNQYGILVQGYESWQYDANGNVTRYERHTQLPNVRSSIQTWQYDSNDNEVRSVEDSDADGTPEHIETWQYQYDADGNLTRAQYNRDGDGTPHSIESWQYDARGNMTRYEHADPDGTPNNAEAWQYDANGNVTQYRVESYGGGTPVNTPDNIETWDYDADGKLTRYARDDDGDGTPDMIETLHYQYDANGNVIRKERVDEDNGKLVVIETWQYDGNGNVTRHTKDDDSGCEEGLWLSFASHRLESWQYHANGNVLLHEIETTLFTCEEDEEDEEIDGRSRYQYDANGNLTRYERYGEGMSWPEHEETWQYDADGNLTRHDEGVDFDSIETWQYDGNSNVTRYEWNDRDDDETAGATTYRYEATGWGHLFSRIAVFGHNSTPPENPRPDVDELE